MRGIACCALLAAFMGGPGARAQERPLPALEPFLKEVRLRLEADDDRSSAYVFTRTERTHKVDGAGRLLGESVDVSESYPGFGPGEQRWRLLIENDGKPVPASELRKKEEERQKKAEEYARRLQDPAERAKVARERAKQAADNREAVDDVFRVFDIAMLGRETIEGHGTIALSLTPKPNARGRTREGRMFSAFKGRAWVSESEYELVRLDLEATRDISIAMGLLARLDKGTILSTSRRKVNGEAWLPAKAEYNVSARVLLLKRLREQGTVEFSNYRKFSVDTSTTIALPPVD
jgi:hypothetical protein